MAYVQRVVEEKLKEYLSFFSATSITGPRQSGKSTLLTHALREYHYITFDDLRVVNTFYDDPEKFMRTHANKIIFDEVQKIPEIFSYIKRYIDEDRDTTGKFVLSGSSQFQMIKGISESLAGRVGELTLLPYQFSELPKHARSESIFRGCYPELVNKHYKMFNEWFASYLNTYITRDLTSMANIGDLRDFQRLIQLLAANTSQLLNMSHYANDIGVDVKTIKRWISILEASYIIFLLPPYYKNFGKRIVKSPKIYFYDTGLCSSLLGIDSEEIFEKGPMAGSIFENYMVSEILKKELHRVTHAKLYYYRTSAGHEIDLIIDRKQKLDFIEIKNSETFHPRMVSAINEFMSNNAMGYLLYRGKNFPYQEKLKVINYQEYLLDQS